MPRASNVVSDRTIERDRFFNVCAGLSRKEILIASTLASWSFYSGNFWHDYHIHPDESLDDVVKIADKGGHSILHAVCFSPNFNEARRILAFAPELASQTNFCAGDTPAHYCTYFSVDRQTGYRPNHRLEILKLLY